MYGKHAHLDLGTRIGLGSPDDPKGPVMADLSQLKASAPANGEVVHLFHSEVLFIKGMPITSIYIISKGSIIIFSGDGGRVVRWAGPHQILGMNEVMCGGAWKGIGIAQGNVELVAYNHMNLRAVIDKIPKAHKRLLDDLLLTRPSEEP
jgi:CRP-like cAMP-binding protein